MKRVVVISPHPDDESIGCGGTICDHIAKGDDVRVVFLTSGEAGNGSGPPADREGEAKEAAAILGVSSLDFWRLPDGRLKAGADLIGRMRSLIDDARPDIVYVPHRLELHPDHRAAFRAVRGAVSGRGQAPPVVLTYEVWTPLPEVDHLVDISDHMDTKLAAIRAHKSQVALVPFDEAAQALARYRGAIYSWPGGPYAETFMRWRG